MKALFVMVALLACLGGPAEGDRSEGNLASLARPVRERARNQPARTYTNADVRKASGNMMFSRPSGTWGVGAANARPLRPATRSQPKNQPNAPPPGDGERSPFISDLPWGAEFKSAAQRELERFNTQPGHSSQMSGRKRQPGSSKLKTQPRKTR